MERDEDGRAAVCNGRADGFCEWEGGRFLLKRPAREIFSFFARRGKIRSRKEDRKAAGPAADFLGRTGIRAD